MQQSLAPSAVLEIRSGALAGCWIADNENFQQKTEEKARKGGGGTEEEEEEKGLRAKPPLIYTHILYESVTN